MFLLLRFAGTPGTPEDSGEPLRMTGVYTTELACAGVYATTLACVGSYDEA